MAIVSYFVAFPISKIFNFKAVDQFNRTGQKVALEQWRNLRQKCLQEGLLPPSLGRNNQLRPILWKGKKSWEKFFMKQDGKGGTSISVQLGNICIHSWVHSRVLLGLWEIQLVKNGNKKSFYILILERTDATLTYWRHNVSWRKQPFNQENNYNLRIIWLSLVLSMVQILDSWLWAQPSGILRLLPSSILSFATRRNQNDFYDLSLIRHFTSIIYLFHYSILLL